MKPFIYFLAISLTAHAAARDLFSPPVGRRQVATPSLLREEARVRSVAPVLEALSELRAKEATDLRLNLFDDVSFGMVVEERVDRSGGFSVSGRLSEDDLGSFSFVVHEGVTVGVVRAPGRRQLFRVSSGADGSQAIAEVSESKMPACGVKAAQAQLKAPAAPPPADGIQSNPDPANDITVMIAYTNLARAAAGSTAAMQAECQLAVDTANQCYANSQIIPRLRLVHTIGVAYDEAGTISEHLNRLTELTDGIMDNLHTVRDDVGADMVSLFVADDDAGTIGGRGWIMMSLSNNFASSAFSVCNRDGASTNLAFAHELGHNMGCHHDRDNADGQGLYSYSYGWRFNVGSGTYRTVMAYEPGTRLNVFSNPNVNANGVPTGVPIGQPNESFNAQTINNSASTVANFRHSPYWVDFYSPETTQNGSFTFPYKILATAVAAVPSGATIKIKPSTRYETITITKPMCLDSYNGTATIIGQ